MRVGPAVLLSALLPFAAHAAGQDETVVTGGPGLAVLFDGEAQVGVSGDVRLMHGLSDFWSARLGLGLAWLPATDGGPAKRVVAPTLGLTVAADVLNLVPFAELGVVLADLRGGGLASRQRLGAELSLGIDRLLSRHLTLSALGRVDYLPLRLAGANGSPPLLLVLALCLGYVF
jgi:hypothetical protein